MLGDPSERSHTLRTPPMCAVKCQVVAALRFLSERVPQREKLIPGASRCPAAHNAVGLAGESPAVGIDCLST